MEVLLIPIFVLILISAAVLWAVDQARYQTCPHCREKISRGATRCPKCQSNLTGRAA